MSRLSMTNYAIEKAEQIQGNHPEWQGLFLRLYLAGKGCDGFQYGVAFDQQQTTDLCFFQSNKISVIVDPDTLTFTDGAEIDWKSTEEGEGFVVENPSHKKFRGKFFKRKDWQKRLLQTNQD